MYAGRDRRLFIIKFPKSVNHLVINPYRPKKFLKIKRIHFNNILTPDRDGVDSEVLFDSLFPTLFLQFVAIPLHPEQRTGGNDIKTPVFSEKFQRSPRLRTFLYFVKDETSFTRFKNQPSYLCRKVQQYGIDIL